MKKSNPTSPGGAEHTTTICGMLHNHQLDSLDHLATIIYKQVQVVGWLASFSNWLNDTIPFFLSMGTWVNGSGAFDDMFKRKLNPKY